MEYIVSWRCLKFGKQRNVKTIECSCQNHSDLKDFWTKFVANRPPRWHYPYVTFLVGAKSCWTACRRDLNLQKHGSISGTLCLLSFHSNHCSTISSSADKVESGLSRVSFILCSHTLQGTTGTLKTSDQVPKRLNHSSFIHRFSNPWSKMPAWVPSTSSTMVSTLY